jgi:hypothetical protein
MSIIVVIKREQDRAEWVQYLRNAGLSFSEYSHLPRHFKVDGVTIVTFPLVNHPGCEGSGKLVDCSYYPPSTFLADEFPCHVPTKCVLPLCA